MPSGTLPWRSSDCSSKKSLSLHSAQIILSFPTVALHLSCNAFRVSFSVLSNSLRSLTHREHLISAFVVILLFKMQIFSLADFKCILQCPFYHVPSSAALSHGKPSSAGTSRDSRCAGEMTIGAASWDSGNKQVTRTERGEVERQSAVYENRVVSCLFVTWTFSSTEVPPPRFEWLSQQRAALTDAQWTPAQQSLNSVCCF